jgi:hypothetical protein
VRRLLFNLLAGLAYDLEALGAGARPLSKFRNRKKAMSTAMAFLL